MKTIFRFAAVFGLILPSVASAVLLTNNTLINPLDATFDGQDLVVSNATLTVDGPHAFATLRVESGGALTHTASANGSITQTNHYVEEPQVLVGTNDVTLANSNIITAAVVVKDATNAVAYTNNTDYVVTLAGGQGFVHRTDTSAIPDGAQVLVTYDVTAITVTSGLTLTVTNELTILAGGSIDVSGRGYSGAFGSGHGGPHSSIWPWAGGGGGGYGGNGGIGGYTVSNALGGVSFGLYDQPSNLGGAGGAMSIPGLGTLNGGAGGGSVRLTCLGTLTVNGVITANGANATNTRTGGGAGGSVWLNATDFTGTGSIMASGGGGEPPYGGGGAGGRMAFEFSTNTFVGSVGAHGGAGQQAGGAGTIFTRKFGTLANVVVDNGGMVGGAGTTMSVSSTPNLTVQGRATVLQTAFQTIGNLVVRSNSVVLTTVTNNANFNLNIVSNLIIEATAKLSVNGAGSLPGSGNGVGQVNSFVGAGAGHGGVGGTGSTGPGTNAPGGPPYDLAASPSTQGSGGRSIGTLIGGMGGGVIRLIIGRNFQLDGEMSADALPGYDDRAGGGSGGSIWITTGGLSGGGFMSANGGAGGLPYGGGGGGGRIAVNFVSNNFSGVFLAHGGIGAMAGGAGSVYLKPSSQSFADLLFDNGGLTNAARTFISEGSSYNRLVVSGGAMFAVSNSSVVSFSSISVGTNSALFAGLTPQTFNVTSNVTVAAGAVISADGLVFNNNIVGSGGGGHGGAGGRGSTSVGSTGLLDNATSPNLPGGCGGFGVTSQGGFGRGGGVLTMNISGNLLVDGKITAHGTDASTNLAGGGAGGSISLTVSTFSGAGLLAADGGSGFLPSGGGGGGGRIAVTCNKSSNTFSGSFSTKGGNGYQRGGAGTVYYSKAGLTKIDQTITVDNGGVPGTNTTILASGINFYELIIQGAGFVSSVTGLSPASVLVRSNSWLAAGGSLSVSGDVTLETGGGINLNGVGGSSSGAGNSGTKQGAGHGGYGGGSGSPAGGGNGGAYDSMTSPALAGSTGGGSGTSGPPFGGIGGGALHLTVNGTLRVDGRISADGLNGDPGSGGGSGGSLWLTLNRLTGSGSISAAGGAGIPVSGFGGGGGGRIAITWSSNSFAGPIMARGGSGIVAGGAGTIYLKANNQSSAAVIVDNGGVFGTNTPLSSVYGLPTAYFDLTVGNGARTFFSTTPNLLSNLTVNANGVLIPPSSSLVDLILRGNLTINAGGSVMADGRGFARGAGPGAGGTLGSKGAGGGHGGAGGAASSGAVGGVTNGSPTQPTSPGSGGGAGANSFTGGSDGGGAFKFLVAGTATVNGILSANGYAGLQDDSGGGAGGSIWVTAKAIAGSGVIAADGGDGELYGGGGGGGGRIALYATSTNGFTGTMSVLGGDGANAGQNGTVVFTTNPIPFSILSQSPAGATGNAVSSVAFTFSQLVDAATVSPTLFTLAMPSNYAGPLPILTTSVSSAAVILNASPTLNVPGTYTVIVSPAITDIFGTPMAQPYTNTFSVVIPTVEGSVQDINGIGISGVSVETTGYLPASTDATGNYVLGVPPGWGGTITPSLGANMFAPGSITLTNVTVQTTNQNFIMVDTIAPIVGSGISGTNLLFNWNGLSGVTYQAYWSTNLLDWSVFGSPLPGTNAAMQLELPIGSDGLGFFRLGASN